MGNRRRRALEPSRGSPPFRMKKISIPEARFENVMAVVFGKDVGIATTPFWIDTMEFRIRSMAAHGEFTVLPAGWPTFRTSHLSDEELKKIISDEIDALAGKTVVRRVTIDRNPKRCEFHAEYRAWLRSLSERSLKEPPRRGRRMHRRRLVTL
jgi:hypothetical protein